MKKIVILLSAFALGLPLFAQKQEEMTTKKMMQMMWMIDNFYVDTANMPDVTEKGIIAMLKELDPHSTYIAKKDVQAANEPLQGNIIGIGVTYQLMNDTIHVVDVVADGPSDKVGILPGDK